MIDRTPWRDDETTLIDRFDVRSHLDIIDEYALKQQRHQEDSESVVFQWICSPLCRHSMNKQSLLFYTS